MGYRAILAKSRPAGERRKKKEELPKRSANMESLPTEIVECILSYESLQLEDIRNVILTCKRLKTVVTNSNLVWKSLYSRRWPKYLHHFPVADVDWFKEVQLLCKVRLKAIALLEEMPRKLHKEIYLSHDDLQDWDPFVVEDKTYDYVVDFLTRFTTDRSQINSIKPVPLFTQGNQTLAFYCYKVIVHLRQEKVRREFHELLTMPEEQRILENVAVMLAQWCQPFIEVSREDISGKLDELFEQTRSQLFWKNPNHPFFQVDQTTLNKWKAKNLKKNQFDDAECMEILETMRTVLFDINVFFCTPQDCLHKEKCYINKVLENKHGLPILLSIVYESVARRMGINLEPTNIPAHFMLKFTPKGRKSSELFIAANDGGRFVSKGVCPFSHSSSYNEPRATAHGVLMKMSANLMELINNPFSKLNGDLMYVRSVMELRFLVCNENIKVFMELLRLYMMMGISCTYIMNLALKNNYEKSIDMKEILQKVYDYEAFRQTCKLNKERTKRTPEMKYAVGVVVKNRISNLIGVITEWIHYKNRHTSYFVYHQNYESEYLNEDELILAELNDPSVLWHRDLGRHFSHFFMNHYIPNPEKESMYPDDGPVRQKIYGSLLWSQPVP